LSHGLLLEGLLLGHRLLLLVELLLLLRRLLVVLLLLSIGLLLLSILGLLAVLHLRRSLVRSKLLLSNSIAERPSGELVGGLVGNMLVTSNDLASVLVLAGSSSFG